jgi:tRNA(Arg) A34 adenosine deaminase TadA
MSTENFMDRAIFLATENVRENAGGPFGCVITRDGEMIAEGKNMVTRLNDPTAHAEIVALRAACQKLQSIDLSDCSVYSSCEPCPMCYSALKWANISDIYYSNTRNEADQIGFSDNSIYTQIIEKTQTMVPLRRKQSLEAFKEWQESTDKIKY